MAELLEVVKPSIGSNIMEAFPELDVHGMTVHDCFKMMSDKIRSFPEKKEECSEAQNKKIEALTKLMSAMNNSSDFKLEQNKHLLKRVSRGGYKRATKKRATKKRATKKRRNKCSKNLSQRFL
jgi:cation transport ATPase